MSNPNMVTFRKLRPVKEKRELYGKARIAVGGQAPEAEVDSGGENL